MKEETQKITYKEIVDQHSQLKYKLGAYKNVVEKLENLIEQHNKLIMQFDSIPNEVIRRDWLYCYNFTNSWFEEPTLGLVVASLQEYYEGKEKQK